MPNDVLLLSDLRRAVNLSLDAFEAEHGPVLQIQHDHYWHLPVEASFDLEAEPSEFTAGQISDDLKEVRNMLARGDAGPAWHELSHVLGLLRVVEAAARQ